MKAREFFRTLFNFSSAEKESKDKAINLAGVWIIYSLSFAFLSYLWGEVGVIPYFFVLVVTSFFLVTFSAKQKRDQGEEVDPEIFLYTIVLLALMLSCLGLFFLFLQETFTFLGVLPFTFIFALLSYNNFLSEKEAKVKVEEETKEEA